MLSALSDNCLIRNVDCFARAGCLAPFRCFGCAPDNPRRPLVNTASNISCMLLPCTFLVVTLTEIVSGSSLTRGNSTTFRAPAVVLGASFGRAYARQEFRIVLSGGDPSVFVIPSIDKTGGEHDNLWLLWCDRRLREYALECASCGLIVDLTAHVAASSSSTLSVISGMGG